MFEVVRTMVVWCPDWPVVATGLSLSLPIAVLDGQSVLASSPVARYEGVHAGLRRREAQAKCPELVVVEHEPERDARVFEPIVMTLEELAPRVEIIEPGTCAVATRGPSRYFGGDEALVQHVTMLLEEAIVNANLTAKCCVGIADGMFAATLAARAAMVVPPMTSATFLAPQPLSVLNRPELVDLLRRLGIRTLGDFAALPSADVLGRFGADGIVAHRLAQGLDPEPFQARKPPLELSVKSELDPPVQRVDAAAFVARSLADQLHERLSAEGLACNRLLIEAETEHGETLSRTWRHDGRLSAGAIAERVRWQLDGWLTNRGEKLETDDGFEPSAGIIVLRLVPEGLLPDNGSQLGFWGGSIDADERTARALARVQGLLGEESVMTAVVGGGRSPKDQVHLVPWGVAREPGKAGFPDSFNATEQSLFNFGLAAGKSSKKSKGRSKRATPPEVPCWPGRLPAPAPATVYDVWPKAEVTDADGERVTVDGRGMLSAPPALIAVDGGVKSNVTGWTGPWLIDEKWWDITAHRRRARLQLVTASGEALLAALEKRQWWIEAMYD